MSAIAYLHCNAHPSDTPVAASANTGAIGALVGWGGGFAQDWIARRWLSAMKSMRTMSLRCNLEIPMKRLSISTIQLHSRAASGCSFIAQAVANVSGTIAAPHRAGTRRCGASEHSAAKGVTSSYGHESRPS